jgi:hypothetical protein
MNKLTLVLVVAFAATLTPAIGQADKGARNKNAIDCAKQPSHTINTGDNTITYTGTCERIVINGGDNRLTIENVKQLAVNGGNNVVDIGGVDQISINGDGNKINYKKGLSGAKPRITSTSAHNEATQAK